MHVEEASAQQEVDLPIEVVILLVAGTMLLIAGLLLFAISAWRLPCYPNGLYGSLLVMFGLQIMALGKTPFGEMQRSRGLVAIGMGMASIGMVACFVPDVLAQLPRILLSLCLGLGGLVQLLQMFLAREKLRTWLDQGDIFRHLSLACGAVYLLSVTVGLVVWKPELLATSVVATVLLVHGLSVIYLAVVLHKIYGAWPQATGPRHGGLQLTPDQVLLLLTGVLQLILGTLLIPVNLGLLPFSGSAQLGLLMLIISIQTLSSGNTPLGLFRRTPLLVLVGLLWAALGVVSCVLPDILISPLTVLVGVLNLLGGLITLVKICLSRKTDPPVPDARISALLTRLFATQLTLNLLTILFGASMLIANLIHGLILGVILIATGVVILSMLHLLTVLNVASHGSQGA